MTYGGKITADRSRETFRGLQEANRRNHVWRRLSRLILLNVTRAQLSWRGPSRDLDSPSTVTMLLCARSRREFRVI